MFAEQQPYVRLLLESNPMLAGDAAAKLDAGSQGCRTRFNHPVQFAWRAHIKEYIRVKVAIAGMEYIGDPKIELPADFRHALHHLGQLAPGHNTVLNIIIRRQCTHSSESALSAFPQKLPFGIVFSDPNFARTAACAKRLH